MKEYKDLNWHWFKADNEPLYEIMGKYLFFSHTEKKLLKFIAKKEIEEYNFPLAKVNNRLINDKDDYVLCLYYKDNSRIKELEKRNNEIYHVRYRYWKSDKDTKEGKYSIKYLNILLNEVD